MRTSGVLGGIALVAILAAAVCFAVVDVTTTGSELCEVSTTACSAPAFAPYTPWFAAGGGVALLICAIAGLTALARVLRSPAPSAADEDAAGPATDG